MFLIFIKKRQIIEDISTKVLSLIVRAAFSVATRHIHLLVSECGVFILEYLIKLLDYISCHSH